MTSSRPAEAWNPTPDGSAWTEVARPDDREAEGRATTSGHALEAADRMEAVQPLAADLICAVHDVDRVRVADLLAGADILPLVVVLAAMVPDDARLSDTLAWTADLPEPKLAPHGSHAAYTRHKYQREEPCAACVEGERMYQRVRYARRKRQRAVA